MNTFIVTDYSSYKEYPIQAERYEVIDGTITLYDSQGSLISTFSSQKFFIQKSIESRKFNAFPSCTSKKHTLNDSLKEQIKREKEKQDESKKELQERAYKHLQWFNKTLIEMDNRCKEIEKRHIEEEKNRDLEEKICKDISEWQEYAKSFKLNIKECERVFEDLIEKNKQEDKRISSWLMQIDIPSLMDSVRKLQEEKRLNELREQNKTKIQKLLEQLINLLK